MTHFFLGSYLLVSIFSPFSETRKFSSGSINVSDNSGLCLNGSYQTLFSFFYASLLLLSQFWQCKKTTSCFGNSFFPSQISQNARKKTSKQRRKLAAKKDFFRECLQWESPPYIHNACFKEYFQLKQVLNSVLYHFPLLFFVWPAHWSLANLSRRFERPRVEF